MSDDYKLRALRMLTENLQVWSAHCAKILTKGGKLAPFEWNQAQRYIHERLEKQKAEIGYVRALILKGRQQGCCYAPDTRVLTADYRWKRIGDLEIGERLLAVDENLGPLNGAGRRTERRIRNAVVEFKTAFEHPVFRVTMASGIQLTVTGEHRHLCRVRKGVETEWRTVHDTQVGDVIRVLCPPPSSGDSHEDGWFGGLLDGEGSFGAYPAVRIALSQVDGPVLRRAKAYLDSVGIRYYELVDSRKQMAGYSKLGDKPVHCLRVDRCSDVIKLLARCRPTRFVERDLFVGKKLPKSCENFEAWDRVVSIEPAGVQQVVDIQTSEKTFIAEGLVSHNSTYVAARFYHQTSTRPGRRAFIVAHEDKATANLFSMVKRYHDHNAIAPSTKASNAQELIFGALDSGYKLATAGSKDVGRSNTAQLLHGSEAGFWDNAQSHLAGLGNTVPSGAEGAGTEIILESTANGLGNMFHLLWQEAEAGRGEYQAIFVPWFWQQEYRAPVRPDMELSDEDRIYQAAYGLDPQQMQWRANKIAEYGAGYEWLFDQEYPATPALAFRVPTGKPLISPAVVSAAANNDFRRREGPLIIGVDPASDGEDPSATRDRTAIAFRQGRTCFRIEAHQDLSAMAVAGKLAEYNAKFKPDAIFVDKGGIGSGIVDRLKELNVPVIGVLFGAAAGDKDVYLNKRAEMWWRLKEWLEDQPARIPNDASLIADLAAPQPVERSDRKKQLESKKDMAKRQIRSPDCGDALALTFAQEVAPREDSGLPANPGGGGSHVGY